MVKHHLLGSVVVLSLLVACRSNIPDSGQPTPEPATPTASDPTCGAESLNDFVNLGTLTGNLNDGEALGEVPSILVFCASAQDLITDNHERRCYAFTFIGILHKMPL